MDFITKKINDINVIELSGNIMGGPESTKINQELHSFIEKGESKFIIDLKNVTVMNSSGLGTLIRAFPQ
jgi:anti-sigma B factor antagonist